MLETMGSGIRPASCCRLLAPEQMPKENLTCVILIRDHCLGQFHQNAGALSKFSWNGLSLICFYQLVIGYGWLQEACALGQGSSAAETLPGDAVSWRLSADSTPSTWEQKYFCEGGFGERLSMTATGHNELGL